MLRKNFWSTTFSLLIISLSSIVSGRVIEQNDEFSVKVNQEPLDPQGNYLLSWYVNLTEGRITFDLEAPTKGYVGFGISPFGGMASADIFVAGVFDNGTAYVFVSYIIPFEIYIYFE